MQKVNHFVSVLTSTEAQNFWAEEAETLSAQLTNRAQKQFGPDAAIVLQQLELRRKARHKFPELLENGWLFSPQGFEQASSSATASYKASLIKGKVLVDLTAGAGIDAFYLSRNFESAILLEIHPERAALLRWNFREYAHVQVLEMAAEAWMPALENEMVVFVDPDRRPAGRKVSGLTDSSPDILGLLPQIRAKNCRLWLKASPMLDISQARMQLGENLDCRAIAVDSELKELLFEVDLPAGRTPQLHSIKLNGAGQPIHLYAHTFQNTPEKPALASAGAADYFVEPHLALIKTRQARSFAAAQGWLALNGQADYYLHHTPEPAMAGRWFKIVEHWPYKPKTLVSELQKRGITKANVAKREFFMEVSEIRKRLKLADGGEEYLFFTKNKNGEPWVIHGRRC